MSRQNDDQETRRPRAGKPTWKPRQSFRIDPEDWEQLIAAAQYNETNASEVLRDLAKDYVARTAAQRLRDEALRQQGREEAQAAG